MTHREQRQSIDRIGCQAFLDNRWFRSLLTPLTLENMVVMTQADFIANDLKKSQKKGVIFPLLYRKHS